MNATPSRIAFVGLNRASKYRSKVSIALPSLYGQTIPWYLSVATSRIPVNAGSVAPDTPTATANPVTPAIDPETSTPRSLPTVPTLSAVRVTTPIALDAVNGHLVSALILATIEEAIMVAVLPLATATSYLCSVSDPATTTNVPASVAVPTIVMVFVPAVPAPSASGIISI